MHPSISKPRQAGMTLVEILVSITISLLLLAGVLQIFISSKTTYRVQEGLSRLQENGRFAIGTLARDIRMAGFQGCTNLEALEPNIIAQNPPANLVFSLSDFLDGVDNAGAGNSFGAVEGTDVLVLRGASPSGINLWGNLGAVNANIQIDENRPGFEAGEILFITDCTDADIFKATSVSEGGGTVTIAHATSTNTTQNLSKAYKEDAMIMAFRHSAYYVGDTGRINAVGNNILALFRENLDGSSDELIEGVEDMQIEYGVDSDGDLAADVYSTATTVNNGSDWENVVAVRVALLVDSVEDVNPQALAYNFPTFSDNDPGDRRLRREFSITVNLRNRVN